TQVPWMFVSKLETGDSLASPTIACAARWKTTSTPFSRIARATSASSRRSPTRSTTSASIPCSSRPDVRAPSRSRETTCAPSASSCSASQDPPNPRAPVTSAVRPFTAPAPESAAGDGGEDRHLVAVVHGGVEAVLKANVLARDVDVDEAPQIPVLGDPLAEPVVLLEDRVERLTDGGALNLQLALAAGGGAELRGDLHGDAHRAEILIMARGTRRR